MTKKNEEIRERAIRDTLEFIHRRFKSWFNADHVERDGEATVSDFIEEWNQTRDRDDVKLER